MNTFAGTITFEGGVDVSKMNCKKLVVDGENTTVFVFGDTKIENSKDLVEDFETYGEMISHDLSISTEDNMNILNTDFDAEGLYELASFEGLEIDIRDISERFLDAFEVISVREAEESKKFGNRIVKVDFVY
ncbi:hypothetical protein A9Q91_03980 [Candidatus Gracilibacteria bacterium 28_42_T64]|nr:hypothetical protein A9Q91_03980 [Candidatus Gracilibacteria bacterium 28_42_T64]